MKALIIMMAGLMVLSPHAEAASSPSLTLCSYECTEREPFRFSENSWQAINDLFQTPSKSAGQERQRLAEAVALMERDVISQIAREFSDDDFAGHLKDVFTNQDETRNTGGFIALLTDQGLVRLHVLRRSSQRRNLIGVAQSTSVIQCTEDGQLYAVDASRTGFGEAPAVILLENWKNDTAVKKISRRIRSFMADDDTGETDHAED